jgi:hypothetical protein
MPPPPPLTIHAVGATKLDSSSGPCTYDTGRHWQRIGNALAAHWQQIQIDFLEATVQRE